MYEQILSLVILFSRAWKAILYFLFFSQKGEANQQKAGGMDSNFLQYCCLHAKPKFELL